MKLEQPKLPPILEPCTSLEDCIREDPYVHGKLFEGCTISNLDIECLHLDGCCFKNVFFEDCRFPMIDMIDTVFENCEVLNLQFSEGAIHRIHFTHCRLMGIEILDSTLKNVTFTECNARYANLSGNQIKQTQFIKSDLSSSSFIQCGYTKTVYDHCKLKESEFYNTSLSGMDLSTSDIEGIGVSQNMLAGAIVNEEQALQLVRLLGIVIKEEPLN